MKNIVENHEFNLVSMQYTDVQLLNLLHENQTYAALLIDMNPALGLVPNVQPGRISYMRDGKEIDANMAHRSLVAYRHVLRALESGKSQHLEGAYKIAVLTDLPEEMQGLLHRSYGRASVQEEQQRQQAIALERKQIRQELASEIKQLEHRMDDALLHDMQAFYAMHTQDAYRDNEQVAGLDQVLQQSDLEEMGFPQKPTLLHKLFGLPKQEEKPAYAK